MFRALGNGLKVMRPCDHWAYVRFEKLQADKRALLQTSYVLLSLQRTGVE